MGDRVKLHLRRGISFAAAFVLLVVMKAPCALGAHYPASGDDSNCSSCHTLDVNEGDANTSYISSAARTFPQIKAYDGLPSNQAPAYLGCTFCHFQNDNTTMRPALNHFQGRLSSHPVGVDFTTPLHTTTNQIYVSSYGSNKPNELDCVDCHDIDLGGGYPQHDTRPANNPYMLRNVTVIGEYDGLCRTCHRSDAPVTVKTVSMQLTKHADGAVGRPLVENDGTVLRTNDLDEDGVADAAGIVDQCRVCHDSHYSSKYKLFNDGKEMHKVGAGEVPDVAITSANCTEVCHYPGDYNNLPAGNYGTYGHGKAESTYRYRNGRPDWTGTTRTMGLACTGCHVSLDIGTKPHVEPTPSGANDRERYKNRFNLNINLQATDAGSVYGNPVWGVCLQCHSGYAEHQGGGVAIGCQDCHDEHAEGSGSTSNVFMIPEQSKDDGFFLPSGSGTHQRSKAGTELVTYDSTRMNTAVVPYAPDVPNEDFFRGNVNGVCDNAECHGSAPWWPGPAGLAGIMGAGGAHLGGQQDPGSDCASCHRHSGDVGGGWRATTICNDCHTDNGADHAAAQGKNATTHNTRHGAGAYIGMCGDCHGGNGPGSPAHNNGTVNFGGARMSAAFDYVRGAAFDDTGCGTAANGCHNADPGEWSANSLDAVGNNACAQCHAAAGKLLDQGGYPAPGVSSVDKHTKHINNDAYVPGDCDDCHGANATAGNQAAHKDGLVTIAAAPPPNPLNDYSPATHTCTNLCHLADVAGKNWADASVLDCTDCHAGTFLGGGAQGPQSGLHGLAAANTTAHDGSFGGVPYGCRDCHADTPTDAHVNGTLNTPATAIFSWDTATYLWAPNLGAPADNSDDTCTASCHTDNNRWWRQWSTDADADHRTATAVTAAVCGVCHGTLDNWRAGLTVDHDKPSLNNGAHTNCEQCHVQPSSPYAWGTDHDALTGTPAEHRIEVNTNPLQNYDAVNGRCASICHTNDLAHTMGASLAFNHEGLAGPAPSCTSCHGYPPTEATSHRGTASVDHDLARGDGGAFLMGRHNECGYCHGVLDNGTMDGFTAQDPASIDGVETYDIGVPGSHANGSVTMNGDRLGNAHATDAGYNAADGGCDSAACHPNDAGHRLVRGNAVELLEIGPGACTICHGTTGSNYWPDGGAQNGPVYENRAGAHQKHVAAIVASNGGTSAADASTCSWCHPGGAHSGDYVAPPADVMDGVASQFKTISGATDADGAFVAATSTCINVDCHAGATTPGWYFAADTAAPVWTPNSGIAASNPGLGGVLNVTWNAATDAYPSNPVTYDLYRSTTNSAAAVFAGPPIATNLANTSAQVAGLAVGTTYYFGVRAKDNWVTRNATANTDISAGVAPGANPWAPGNKTYFLTRSSGANLWAATTTNLSVCGTPTTGLAVASAALWPTMPGPATPPAGRGLLTTARACGTASTNNYMESNASPWSGQYRNFAGFYSAPYPGQTLVQGTATNTFGFQGYYFFDGTDPYNPILYEERALVVFAAVDSSGNTVASSANSVLTPALSNTMAAYALNLSTLSVTVPVGGRLAVLFYFYDHPSSGAATHRIAYDNYSATITNRITVNETLQDVSPPAWSGGVSGIVVQDAGTGGALDVFWNNATDLPAGAPANPVLYDLYRVQSASCTGLWSNRHQAGLVSPSFQDTGLTNGATYCYGVRAKDSWVPPNVTGNTDTATGIPSPGGVFGCTGCHGTPPIAGNNAGSHIAHANGDSDYDDCENCHPGTTSYTNGHQDGSGQLAFDGTAATAAYNGSQLSYTDNAQVIYNDPDGYGILTGSAGDGTDDGTCARARTSATQCHGSGTVDPVWGGTLAGGCGACHDSTGKQASAAPTVTMTSSHTTAPAGANTCADCHAGHFKGVRIPLPPESWSNPNMSATNMRTQLGIAYTTTGGIDLGGPGTVASISSKTTEADICWGCHDVGGQSEWGYNTKTTPAGYPVATFATADGNEESENRGWIYTSTSYATRTSDWTQGFWMSPYDPLLKRRIASVHTASFDPAGQSSSVAANVRGDGRVERSTPTLEYKGRIRCSYCHDVHDTIGPSGKPFLRGTWVSNPYPPELPPRSAYAGSYTNGANTLYPTPRGRSTAREKGGYFIDQNSNSPTSNASMDTLAETAGLCTLCHGSNVDTMNYYGSKLWLPGMSNGHANSTQGGSGAGKVNLFTGTRYGYGMAMQASVPGPGYVCGAIGDACDLTYPLSNLMAGRDVPVIANSGWFGGVAGSSTQGGGDYVNWYSPTGIGGASGTGTKAHNFTCSKCHSPHATGLPALLIHSCIDPAQGDYTINGRSGVNLIANNCHRKTSTGDGWHILAPGE